MQFAGVGTGLAKFLDAADKGETSAYVGAVFMGIYCLIFLTIVVRQWVYRKPEQTILATCKNQLGMWLAIGLSMWLLVIVVSKIAAS